MPRRLYFELFKPLVKERDIRRAVVLMGPTKSWKNSYALSYGSGINRKWGKSQKNNIYNHRKPYTTISLLNSYLTIQKKPLV